VGISAGDIFRFGVDFGKIQEKKPKDPTIAEKFNTYKFAEYKESVIELLGRVYARPAYPTSIHGDDTLTGTCEDRETDAIRIKSL
jgi:hypothetical protein